MQKIIVLVGPTAVGKTEYSLEIAERYNCEIVSADSMQLYKFMDIGSAKPTKDEQARVKHHLVDIIDPRESFSVARYQELAKNAITDIQNRGKLPLICGGTGLYVNSLVYKLDFSAPPNDSGYRNELEELASKHEIIDENGNSDLGSAYLYEILKEKSETLANRIHKNNKKKIIRALEVLNESGEEIPNYRENLVKTDDFEPIIICLTRDRAELYERIDKRVDMLIDLGLLEEVKGLMAMGLDEADISMKGIGYKEIISSLKGEYDLPSAIEIVKKNTRHYAKRQLTWFKQYEEIKYFNISEYLDKESCINDIFSYIDYRINE